MKYDISLVFPTSPFLINQQVFPPLGILYLSSYLKKRGWKVQCIDMALGHTLDMIESEVVGVSFTTPQRDEAYRIAQHCYNKGTITIAGGAHPTHMPDECLLHDFDIVVRGEGERALDHILDTLAVGGDVQRVVDNRLDQIEIDEEPFPDRFSIDIHAYDYKIDGRQATTVMTTRGCPYNCSFCARALQGCRMQSAWRTSSEIIHLYERYGFEAFMVFDDVFILNKKRTRQIVRQLEGFGFIFRCFARSNLIDDENCELMNRLGVTEVGIGVESGSDAILRKNLKGTSRKGNLRAFKLLKSHGIRAKAFLIVGLPGESEQTINETIEWIDIAQPDDLDISVFQPLPGSPIFNEPNKFEIEFVYNGNPSWYKGKPGEYESTVSTQHLDGSALVAWRDELERRYKRKELLR